MGTKQTQFQPDLKTGKRATVPMGGPQAPHISHMSHGMADQTPHKTGNIARDGAPKHLNPVPVAAGMHTKHKTAKVFVQGGLTASYDSDPANPLNSGPPRGKRLTAPAPVPGQRSRTNDVEGALPGENHARNRGRGVDTALGAKILSQAMSFADRATKMAYGVSDDE
jgi:hypothetical protein